MKRLLAALAIIAGAAVAFGPDEAEARQRQKPGCTTPKFETPVAPPIAQAPVAPPVQFAAPVPIPQQTIVAPPTVVETPAQTVTIPGQTITLPPTTVTVPGQAVTVPGATYTLQQAPVVPLATVPYMQPPCPDDAPKRPFRTFIEQRRLKREKHLGMEEAAAVEPEKETSAACKGKKCRKRFRGWEDAPVLVA